MVTVRFFQGGSPGPVISWVRAQWGTTFSQPIAMAAVLSVPWKVAVIWLFDFGAIVFPAVWLVL